MADAVRDEVTGVLAEVLGGDALPLAAAGRLLPGHRGGRAVNPSTVFRWVTKGVKSPAGRTVRLEAARVGQRWLTSGAGVARFVAALTADAGAPPAAPQTWPPVAPATRSPAARRLASDRAAEALRAAGA